MSRLAGDDVRLDICDRGAADAERGLVSSKSTIGRLKARRPAASPWRRVEHRRMTAGRNLRSERDGLRRQDLCRGHGRVDAAATLTGGQLPEPDAQLLLTGGGIDQRGPLVVRDRDVCLERPTPAHQPVAVVEHEHRAVGVAKVVPRAPQGVVAHEDRLVVLEVQRVLHRAAEVAPLAAQLLERPRIDHADRRCRNRKTLPLGRMRAECCPQNSPSGSLMKSSGRGPMSRAAHSASLRLVRPIRQTTSPVATSTMPAPSSNRARKRRPRRRPCARR